MAKEQKTYYLGTGRRKTAVARVRISDGKGVITINGRSLDHYFTEVKDRAAVLGPLSATELGNRVDVLVKVAGGGITGQADAIRQGIARSIKVMFAPISERRAVTVGNVTAVRSWKKEQRSETLVKSAPVPAAPAPAAAPKPIVPVKLGAEATAATPPEDPAIGIVRKLREGKFLTRDSRMKERKKYGLRGARRGTQFSKR